MIEPPLYEETPCLVGILVNLDILWLHAIAQAIAQYIGNAWPLCCVYDIHDGLLPGAIFTVIRNVMPAGLTEREI